MATLVSTIWNSSSTSVVAPAFISTELERNNFYWYFDRNAVCIEICDTCIKFAETVDNDDKRL